MTRNNTHPTSVVILTEGGSNTGWGHVSRCLGLARAFQERSTNIRMLVNFDKSEDELSGVEFLESYDWLDGAEMVRKVDVVVVDSYQATPAMYQRLASRTHCAVYVDDFAQHDYPPGVVVNGLLYADTLPYSQSNDQVYLLGPSYIPLRQAFWTRRPFSVKPAVQRVLITFGGSEQSRWLETITTMVLDSYQQVDVTVLTSHPDSLQRLQQEHNNLHLQRVELTNDSSFYQILRSHDLTISAGGMTTYELATVGVPTIALKLVSNQSANVTAWYQAGWLEEVLDFEQQPQQQLLSQLSKLLTAYQNPDLRLEKSRVGQRLVDGQGARRVVNRVLTEVERSRNG